LTVANVAAAVAAGPAEGRIDGTCAPIYAATFARSVALASVVAREVIDPAVMFWIAYRITAGAFAAFLIPLMLGGDP
jgi:hypothetical protein